MDDCHSWGFIQTWVWFSNLVWACMSLYCHVHWVQFLFPCSINLQERWRPGVKSILKRWCPVHKRNWQPWRMPILCAYKIWEHLSLNLFIKEVVLHSAFGASTFYSAKDREANTALQALVKGGTAAMERQLQMAAAHSNYLLHKMCKLLICFIDR